MVLGVSRQKNDMSKCLEYPNRNNTVTTVSTIIPQLATIIKTRNYSKMTDRLLKISHSLKFIKK